MAFALALIGRLWIGEKTLMQRMVGKELDLPQEKTTLDEQHRPNKKLQ